MKYITSALEEAFSGEPRLKPLSSREATVMEYLIQGYTKKEIAAALGTATGTVSTYLRAVAAKLRVYGKGREALIAAYLATHASHKVVLRPNRHLMVIEDDMALLEFIIRLLETNDYEVTSWRTSVHAVEQVALYQPKLVLLAHALDAPPNGWEILQALHTQPTTPHIPVILYSAESACIRSYGDQARSMQCDVLETPFDAEVLLAKIEALTLRSNERGSFN